MITNFPILETHLLYQEMFLILTLGLSDPAANEEFRKEALSKMRQMHTRQQISSEASGTLLKLFVQSIQF